MVPAAGRRCVVAHRTALMRWSKDSFGEIMERLPGSRMATGLQNGRLWVLVLAFTVLTLIYYIERVTIAPGHSFTETLFSGPHDFHRTLFLIPVIYAAFVFRIKGCLIASLAFLIIVLPRALYISPYPSPLLRASIYVASAMVLGMLVAVRRNQLEAEQKEREKLTAAYKELTDYDKRLKESQAMLIEAEKLASMGQLAASIAHEVNNPLSGVLIYVQLMRKKLAKREIDERLLLDYLAKVEFEITRSTKLIRNLLDFSSQSAPNLEEVDVHEVLDRALELAVHADPAQARVEKNLGVLPKIIADPAQLQEVLINVIVNGFQAMSQGGTLTIGTSLEKEEVRIAVRDTGCGIPPENMDKLFTPFFSTKKAVKGVGLGLPVSYGIIQCLNGRIEVESVVGEGSTFTICIPISLKNRR